jgi:hypothetical protein
MNYYIVIYDSDTGKAEVEEFTDEIKAENRFKDFTIKPLTPEQTTQVNDIYSKRMASHQSLKESLLQDFADHVVSSRLKSETSTEHPNIQVNLVDAESREDLEKRWPRWFWHKST